jgi:hypothetical protein
MQDVHGACLCRRGEADGGWAESGPARQWWAKSSPAKYNIYLYVCVCVCLKIYDFHAFYFTLFCIISVCILCRKNTKSGIKIPGFRQLKKNLKKEKNVFVHTAKCLKAKKSYCVFHTPKNNVLAYILALITSLLKSREHWPKFQKNNKKFISFVF